MRVYNEILEERSRRTEVVKEWDLLHEDFRSFGGKSKAEREMEEALMPLAQVTPREPLTDFIHSLEREIQLKENIQTLLEWRRNGIATRDEGLLYNELKKLMNEEKLTQEQVDNWNKKPTPHPIIIAKSLLTFVGVLLNFSITRNKQKVKKAGTIIKISELPKTPLYG